MDFGEMINQTFYNMFVSVLFVSHFVNVSVSQDPKVVDTIQDKVTEFINWSQEEGQISSGAVWGAIFAELLEAGPNALPVLIEAFRTVESPQTANLVQTAISRISGIRVVERKPWVEGAGGISAGESHSRLGIEASTPSLIVIDTPLSGVSPLEKKTILLEWWDNLDVRTILNQTVSILKSMESRPVSAPEGTSDTEFAWRQRVFSLEGIAISAQGIFAIPALIEEVSKTNSHATFALLLNCSRNVPEDYDEFLKSGGRKWGSLSEKLAYIRDWWGREHLKYTDLPELERSIVQAVSALSIE